MRSRAIPLLSLLAAVASACSWSDAARPAVVAILPAEAPTHLDVELRIEGRNLDPTVRVDFDDPTRSPVDDGFSVTLVATADRTRVPLADVGLSAPGRLRGTLARDAAVGTYDVEVRDPRGRVALLSAAFSVFAPEPGCEVELAACEDGDHCTESDRCVYGRCQPGTAITCAALDQCHDVGVCEPATGLCSDPAAPDGTTCIDGDACTQADTCQAGACTGASPVVCTALDQCHLAGTCDPGSGLCSDPAALDGTTCIDGDACTQVDTCQAGACTGANPVVCTALDQCHDVGVCDPGTGLCSDPAALDGTTCIDGDACTLTDTCQSGTCYGQNPIVCVESDQCHLAGTCDPGSGLCSDPPAPDGTPCNVSCPSLDQCIGTVCTAMPGTCINTAPLAVLTVTPGGGTAGVTHFTLDASGSTDAETPTTLQFRFDSDGNGDWSAWSTTPTHRQTYAAPGVYTAAVQVRDAAVGGLISYATVIVVVAAPGDAVKVTTALDERDTGATPTSPGGTGLSLREAIAWVNLQPTPKIITLAAPLTITMTGAQRVLRLTAAGAAVVAEAGVVLDFAGFRQACFRLDGPGQRLIGVTITGCTSTFVDMTTISQGSQVAQVTVVGDGRSAIGVDAQAPSAPTSRIGPGNDLSGLSVALNVMGSEYEVVGNRVHASALGAKLYGYRVLVFQNAFFGQVGSAPQAGVGLRAYSGSGAGPVEILQNVFDRNAVHGVQADAVTALTIRNNLFTGNGAYGLNAAAGLTHGYNGYFGNGTGAVTSNLSTDATDVLADPLYVDGPSGDFRLLPQSPAINKGFDTGLDVNGPLNGTLSPHYNGPAPDLGAVESPYPTP